MTRLPVLNRLLAPLRRFAADDRGAFITEGILVVPALIWAYLAMFVFWDGYRTVNRVQKASYALADMISRELAVTPAYLGGLGSVLDYLLASPMGTTLRISSVTFDQADDRFEVLWSCSVKGVQPRLTTASLQTFVDRIPAMSDGNTVVIVEASLTYDAALNIGIPAPPVHQFIVTRPRFAPRVTLTGNSCV